MSFNSIICAFIIIIISQSSHSASISYYGYTLDTDTNIVTGGGLEWLQWDQTEGMSVDTALSTFGDNGWRLASNVEMANLFNAFSFGLSFDSLENTSQSININWVESEDLPTNHFLSLFGQTFNYNEDCELDCTLFDSVDTMITAQAAFGSDMDGDGFFNIARVTDDGWEFPNFGFPIENFTSGLASMSSDSRASDFSQDHSGVALVRVSPVPVPAAAWLFGSALLGLANIKRKKLDN